MIGSWGLSTKKEVSQGVRLKPGASRQYLCGILCCVYRSASESTMQVGKQMVRLGDANAGILPCSGKAFLPWFRSRRAEGPLNVALSLWVFFCFFQVD